MVIQHNLNALNATNRLNTNVIGTKKSTEKLSSGLQINRAADNAAGLAISEKMRAQIRGIGQAIRNANDGISLIQTAEGGLNETHAILQRMRELAVQSANGTYQDFDREAMQLEVDRLKDEIDRISESTEYNKIKLLDGSLSGMEFSVKSFYGARYGIYQYSAAFSQYIAVASDIEGVAIQFTTNASGKGGENAEWSADGKSINIKLSQGQTYTDAQINALIKNAVQAKNGAQTNSPASIEWKTDNGQIIATDFTTAPTVAGARQSLTLDLLPFQAPGGIENTNAIFADKIKFTANQYGSHKDTNGLFSAITITTDAEAGKENVTVDAPAVKGTVGAKITLHLATGTEYTSQYIKQLLLKAGFDYTVEMWDDNAVDGGETAWFSRAGISANGAGGGMVMIPIYETEWVTVQDAITDQVEATLQNPPVDNNGRFQFFAVSNSGNRSQLLYGATSPGTSYPSIKVNDQVYRIWNLPVDQQTTHNAGVWSTSFGLRDAQSDLDMTIVQKISVVNNPAAIGGQSYKIEYEVVNNNQDPVSFDLMYHVDTMLGSNDRAPFFAGGVPVVNNTSYPRDGGMPGKIEIFDDASNPFIFGVAHVDGSGGLPMGSGGAPDILNLAQYNTANTFGNLPNGLVGDSGYSVIWQNRTAPAGGASTAFTTYYGVQSPPLGNFPDLTQLVPIQHIVGYRQLDLGTDGRGLGVNSIKNGGDGLILQIGANGVADQRMTVSIKNMSASALGVGSIDVSTQDAANATIETVDKAINMVSLERASLGAAQNRLEYTVNNLTVTEENLTAAESQIRDTDMATEMVKYTKFNILQQAAQAMLAQANQAPQAILQLLR